MSQVRGIPEPAPDVASLFATVAALKESVESDAQQIRNRNTKQVDTQKVKQEVKAKEAKKKADASLADLTAASKAQIDDHELRIAALESTTP